MAMAVAVVVVAAAGAVGAPPVVVEGVPVAEQLLESLKANVSHAASGAM